MNWIKSFDFVTMVVEDFVADNKNMVLLDKEALSAFETVCEKIDGVIPQFGGREFSVGVSESGDGYSVRVTFVCANPTKDAIDSLCQELYSCEPILRPSDDGSETFVELRYKAPLSVMK